MITPFFKKNNQFPTFSFSSIENTLLFCPLADYIVSSCSPMHHKPTISNGWGCANHAHTEYCTTMSQSLDETERPKPKVSQVTQHSLNWWRYEFGCNEFGSFILAIAAVAINHHTCVGGQMVMMMTMIGGEYQRWGWRINDNDNSDDGDDDHRAGGLAVLLVWSFSVVVVVSK